MTFWETLCWVKMSALPFSDGWLYEPILLDNKYNVTSQHNQEWTFFLLKFAIICLINYFTLALCQFNPRNIVETGENATNIIFALTLISYGSKKPDQTPVITGTDVMLFCFAKRSLRWNLSICSGSKFETSLEISYPDLGCCFALILTKKGAVIGIASSVWEGWKLIKYERWTEGQSCLLKVQKMEVNNSNEAPSKIRGSLIFGLIFQVNHGGNHQLITFTFTIYGIITLLLIHNEWFRTVIQKPHEPSYGAIV